MGCSANTQRKLAEHGGDLLNVLLTESLKLLAAADKQDGHLIPHSDRVCVASASTPLLPPKKLCQHVSNARLVSSSETRSLLNEILLPFYTLSPSMTAGPL